MKKGLTYIALLLTATSALNAQYISEVHEYVPAPSQYMNAAPWGTPRSAESIIGGINGHVSLGAFGGYIVFSFADAVENHPGNPFGVDFTIFGNPLPNWSEPGIVSVMKDDNQNGEPDDTWYELAGSDYNFSTTLRNYEVTYTNPGGHDSLDIPWIDMLGNKGLIETNSFFFQSYYPHPDSFPNINIENYRLKGSMIKSTVDTAFEASFLSLKRGFGYVDNQFRGKAPFTHPDNPYTNEVENSGGDAFDISWAIDSIGSYIDLDEIDFIKVHTGVMDGAGWLGQISTEIVGAVDVEPKESSKGKNKLLVIREIPLVLDTSSFQMEVFAFENGRIKHDEKIRWTCSTEDAYVDENNILHVNQSGALTIRAELSSDHMVSTNVSTTVELGTTSQVDNTSLSQLISIYPNPAQEFISLQSGDWDYVTILDVSGKTIIRANIVSDNETINIAHLSSGVYFIRAFQNSILYNRKFIKE